MRKLNALIVLVFLAPASKAPGQTTQPVEQPWPRAVNEFSKALIAGDSAAVTALMGERAVVRVFHQRDEETALPLLLERAGKAHLIGAHPALHPAPTMAATLADSFRKSLLVSVAMKKKMTPSDDAAMKAANATAAAWMATELNARKDDPVAVIVLWCKKPAPSVLIADRPPEPTEMEPLWILVKGQETPAKDYRITMVVFGDPLGQ